MIEQSLLEDYNQSRITPADFNASFQTHGKFCYAPSASLYFAHEGKVFACCENREHLLGAYPSNSIAEIWKGESAAQLRKFIDEKNLWHGCKGCDFDLKSRNFGGVKAKAFDYAGMQQSDPRYPSMMEFELENTCNLECVMCTGIFSSSIRKNREHLPIIPTPYDDEFVRQLEEFIPHLALANFFGGEPFLVEIYYKIWEKMGELNPGMNVWVTSNGTILNNRVKDLLSRIRFNLTISIDSIKKETYEKIRVNSSFERVMENFEYFHQYTKSIHSDFTVNTCPMTLNWQGLPGMVKWADDEGVALNIIAVRYPESLSLSSMSAQKLAEILDYYNSATFSTADNFSGRNKKKFEDYVRYVQQWHLYKKEMEKISNGSGALQPLDEIRCRIKANLHLSSNSEEAIDDQAQAVMGRLQRLHEKVQLSYPSMSNEAWNLALKSKTEELLYAMMMMSDEEILAQAENLLAGKSNAAPYLNR